MLTARPLFSDTELRDAETSLVLIAQAPFRADIARINNKKPPDPLISPYTGEISERMVQTQRGCLVQELNSHTLDDAQLLQAVMRSESAINSRPITPVSTDPDDREALTRDHFLQWKMNGPLAETPDDWTLTQTWKYVQQISDKLWIRFQQELLPQSHNMPKWWKQINPFQPGQLVVVLDNNPLKTSWTRGRIVQVFEGSDNLQRSAMVRTSTGTYKRPVHLLAPLLADERLPQTLEEQKHI